MNIISILRQRVLDEGRASINSDEYNQLQSEWITRVIPEHLLDEIVKKFAAEIIEAFADKDSPSEPFLVDHQKLMLLACKVNEG